MDKFKCNTTIDVATTATTQSAHTLELRLQMMYNYECRYRREFYLKSGTAKEKFQENEIVDGLVPFHNNSQSCHNESQERSTHTTASDNGDDNIPPSTKTGPQIEEVLVRNEKKRKFMTLSSTVANKNCMCLWFSKTIN